MSGTVNGGYKAAAKNKASDPNFYKNIGRKGGLISRGGPFAIDRDFAARMGKIGGAASRRGKTVAK